jgi:hypothetical protein
MEYPPYPHLPGLTKYRRLARNGLATLSRDEVKAYGQAVLDAILKLNTAPPRVYTPPCKCASGTRFPDGASILKAVAEQNRHRAIAEKDTRTDDDILDQYNEAMRAKQQSMLRAA